MPGRVIDIDNVDTHATLFTGSYQKRGTGVST